MMLQSHISLSLSLSLSLLVWFLTLGSLISFSEDTHTQKEKECYIFDDHVYSGIFHSTALCPSSKKVIFFLFFSYIVQKEGYKSFCINVLLLLLLSLFNVFLTSSISSSNTLLPST